MAKAVWNGTVLAESDSTEIVEGNHYFPPDSVSWDRMKPSAKQSICPWKGDGAPFVGPTVMGGSGGFRGSIGQRTRWG